MWSNDEVKAAVMRKEGAWKEVFTASDKEAKKKKLYMKKKAYRKEKINVKICIYLNSYHTHPAIYNHPR